MSRTLRFPISPARAPRETFTHSSNIIRRPPPRRQRTRGFAADKYSVEIELLDAREMLGRFNLLMRDVMAGCTARNSFTAWEAELLVDMAGCGLDPARTRSILTGYRNAAVRRLTVGRLPPLKLSEYLKTNQD